jgi:hypothetical protein
MTHERVSSLFFLLVSIMVLIGSIRLGIGTTRAPGAGFITFGASALLGILSLSLVVKTLVKKQEPEEAVFRGTLWWRVAFAGLAVLGYALLLPILGYLITSFLLMSFLYWLVRAQRWYWIIISSLLSSLASWGLFSKLLNCQFPTGIFGL